MANPSASGAWRFSLASLLMATTVISLWLGLLRVSPEIGALVGVLAATACLRTAAITRRMQEQGKLVRTTDKVRLFFASLGMLVALPVAGAAMLYGCLWFNPVVFWQFGYYELATVFGFLGAISTMLILYGALERMSD